MISISFLFDQILAFNYDSFMTSNFETQSPLSLRELLLSYL